MNDKISERNERIKLISKLKEKITKEIDNIMEYNKASISFGLENKEDFIELCNEVTICNELLRFINKNNVFMQYYKENNNRIDYIISRKHLLMWLQEDFYFTLNVINKFKANVFYLTGRKTEEKLNYLTSAIQDVIFDEKMNKICFKNGGK